MHRFIQNRMCSRRKILTAGVSLAASAACLQLARGAAGLTDDQQHRREAVRRYLGKQHWKPRGCIYVPARAWNDYQTWRNYDPHEARRDIGFARRLGINAFRVWLSYEFWLHDADALLSHFNDFLTACAAAGIRVMPDLFESDGVEPTKANLNDTNPWTASDVVSPATKVVNDKRLWGKPMEYVQWFMHHFGNDRRLLAIEVDNEPWAPWRMIFAREVMRVARRANGVVPLTVGGNRTAQSMYFLNDGIDILQTHCNFPLTAAAVRNRIHGEITIPQMVLDMPIWMTEWQRLRPHGSGWGGGHLQGNAWQPDYRSMAPLVHHAEIGNFFWSLMLKPAWLLVQRHEGTISGVFHEDGRVWSNADARAISQNPAFHAPELKAWPTWAHAIPRKLGLPVKIAGDTTQKSP